MHLVLKCLKYAKCWDTNNSYLSISISSNTAPARRGSIPDSPGWGGTRSGPPLGTSRVLHCSMLPLQTRYCNYSYLICLSQEIIINTIRLGTVRLAHSTWIATDTEYLRKHENKYMREKAQEHNTGETEMNGRETVLCSLAWCEKVGKALPV